MSLLELALEVPAAVLEIALSHTSFDEARSEGGENADGEPGTE